MAIIGDPDLVSPDAAQTAMSRLRAERDNAIKAMEWAEKRWAACDARLHARVTEADALQAENRALKAKLAASFTQEHIDLLKDVIGDRTKVLDEAARFIAGLNLQDHPRATVQAQRAMVMKLNDVLRPQCSKNDVMASGAAYSNAALKDDTMADTIRVFAPGRRSPIDFKINLGGKDIGLGEAKRAHEDDLSRQLLGALPTSNLPVSTDPDVLPRRCGGCAKLINERGTHGCLGGVALGYAR